MVSPRNPAPSDLGQGAILRAADGKLSLRDADAETNDDEEIGETDFYVLCPAIGVRVQSLEPPMWCVRS